MPTVSLDLMAPHMPTVILESAALDAPAFTLDPLAAALTHKVFLNLVAKHMLTVSFDLAAQHMPSSSLVSQSRFGRVRVERLRVEDV